jgi:glycine cleavage system aminomethyltransferase T
MTGALAFLSTGGAEGSAPVAVSPLASGMATAGATFEARDGWQVAARFAEPAAEALACRETVAWADASHLPKWELQGPADALDALDPLPALGGDGLAARDGDGAWWCRATPTRALVLGAAGTADALRERLAGAAAPSRVRALDVTSQLGALRIAGPLARELFARFCALDLRPQAAPPRAFRPGSVARTPGCVLCEAPDRFLTLFGAAYGAYVWELVSDAGVHLGGRPVGVDALVASEEPSHA